MNTPRYFALVCAAIVAASATGCSSSTESSGSPVASSMDSHATLETQTSDSAEAVQSQSHKTVKVTAVDGNKITADEGEITAASMGSAPDGAAPNKPADSDNGSSPDGTPPEMPADNGSAHDGEPPARPGESGSAFESNGSSVEFTVTDDTEISLEFLQGSSAGSVDDITVGSVLAVTLNDDGTAASVLVKNMAAGGGFGGSSGVTNGTSANTITESTEESDTEYTSIGDDENALRIDSAEAVLTNITVNKNGGSSSNTENGDFYGQNAGLLATNGAKVIISDSTFNTGAVNGNAVFSYGEGTSVMISDSVIRTTERNSGGIQTTGGGTMTANNLDVETQGNSSAAVRSDRGGGTVTVNGGKYVTNGTGSPAVYSTADVTVNNAELTANASEGVVVEGKNSVKLTNCTLSGDMSGTYNGDPDENIHTIMIYQSMSGDADIGEACFTAEGGSITGLSGDMFYVTNTDCTISLKNVEFTLADDTFLRVEGNSSSRGWGAHGSNGGDVILNAETQNIEGNILVDSISSLDMTLTGSTLKGAVNPDGDGGTVKVTLDKDSEWELTADSYITEFDGDVSQIVSNGYHLYVNGEQVV